MPSDAFFERTTALQAPVVTRPVRIASRLPLGIGLLFAAGVSGGLWVMAIAGVRAILS